MVRKKASVPGKGKAVASSSRLEIEEDIVEEMDMDSDEDSAPLESRTGKREKRQKRRTREEMAADAKLDWVESIPGRGFKSERQVSRRSFGNNSDIILQLGNQGLLFWCRALFGYNAAGVIEFYQNLDTSEALAKGKISSKVNNKKIVVDAKKEKKERKKLSREVEELKDELRWHTQYIESTSDEKYEAPPRVEEADSEEEILFEDLIVYTNSKYGNMNLCSWEPVTPS
ncbi:hypothetical protein RHGRI_022980 [Rhododendron griersonianum]|uniref:Uncharacterized protein n=1 Tax=Rhododendron griersonianum TaxID=479676 RepID=A0AAV6J577_9ERIC|nr:hypothetical protein RHGRI_022980 [Rhododendron griersonianum]